MSETEQAQDRDFEGEARTSGWVPQDQWKGSAERWVDAKTFMQRGEEYFPFVQAKLKKEIGSLKSELDEVRTVSQQFREFSEKAIARERQEREQAVAELERVRTKAVSDGDGEAFARADKQLTELRKELPPVVSEPPEVAEWKKANAWYGTDRELSAIADGLSDVVKAENPTLKGKAFLDKLTERVQGVVPHKFQNSRRDESLTGDNQRKRPSKTGRTYEDLPESAKTACEKFIKQVPGFTKEAYLSQYVWSE